MIELACRDVVFHFNKGHLADPTIPLWVLKTKGKTYYINHLDATIPWSTKETPDNPHTKGSIKFKECLCQIDNDNCATLSPLTEEDKIRLDEAEEAPCRILYMGEGVNLEETLNKHEIVHTKVKKIFGACSETKQICDLVNKEDASMALLLLPSLRILQENEFFYKAYDDSDADENSDAEDYSDDDYSDDDCDTDQAVIDIIAPKIPLMSRVARAVKIFSK